MDFLRHVYKEKKHAMQDAILVLKARTKPVDEVADHEEVEAALSRLSRLGGDAAIKLVADAIKAGFRY